MYYFAVRITGEITGTKLTSIRPPWEHFSRGAIPFCIAPFPKTLSQRVFFSSVERWALITDTAPRPNNVRFVGFWWKWHSAALSCCSGVFPTVYTVVHGDATRRCRYLLPSGIKKCVVRSWWVERERREKNPEYKRSRATLSTIALVKIPNHQN